MSLVRRRDEAAVLAFCAREPVSAVRPLNLDDALAQLFVRLFEGALDRNPGTMARMLPFFTRWIGGDPRPKRDMFGRFAARSVLFLDRGDLIGALTYSIFGPNQVVEDLRRTARFGKLCALISAQQPFDAIVRGQLEVLFKCLTINEKKQLFHAQFSLATNIDEISQKDEEQLDEAYRTFSLLPSRHVQAVRQLKREPQYVVGAAGTFDAKNRVVSVHDLVGQVIRHEMGHAVEDLLRRMGKGSVVDALFQRAGWKTYRLEEMVTAMGGIGDLPDDVQAIVSGALRQLFRLGGSWENGISLADMIRRTNIDRFGFSPKTEGNVKKQVELLNDYNSHPVVGLLITSQGARSYHSYERYPAYRGSRFVYNKYHNQGASLSEETWSDLFPSLNVHAGYASTWPGEWLANHYAQRFEYGEPVTQKAKLPWLEEFFAQHVDTIKA